jgi:hypothetical protein
MDRMQAPPRNAFFGLLSDLASGTVGYMQDPRRTQQLQGLAAMLESTRIPSLLEGLSYGDSMTTGSGMTMRPNKDVRGLIELATAFAPAGKPAAAAAKAGTMALGRAGERVGMAAEKALEAPLQRAYDKGGLSREMLLAMGQGTISPATVFHGSPHLFQKFDSSKIGTGEGAQVYGHGLYLAENPAVANDYKRQLSSEFFWRDLDAALPTALKGKAPDWTDALLSGKTVDDLASTLKRPWEKSLLQQNKAKIESVIDAHKASGNLYQVDLPDEQIAKMLDFDKPLSEQSEFVRKAIQENELDYVPDRLTGGRLLEELHKGFAPDVAAKHLRDAGIPGIRYLDQGSRGTGKGTSNFVVFPGMEDMLRIEQINEQPINSLLQTLGR